MMKPIPPTGDFWQRLLEEVNKTTEEEWTRFFEEYEKECKPMEDTKDLCNQVLELIEDLGEPSLLRFDDITIVSSFGEYDCYGDKQKAIRFKTEKTLQEVKASIVAESYGSQGFYIFDNEYENAKDVAGINISNANSVYIKQEL